MPYSVFEDELDEFSTRYMESCRDVFMNQPYLPILLTRLSSPLLVIDTTEAKSHSIDAIAGFQRSPIRQPSPQLARGYTVKQGLERSVSPVNLLPCEVDLKSHQFTDSDLSSDSSGSVSPESLTQKESSLGSRPLSKIKSAHSKSSGKSLRLATLVGNPFYRKSPLVGSVLSLVRLVR